MSIADKLTQIAENEQKVFDAGAKSEYDRFWDSYQYYGELRYYKYSFAGRGWNGETFKPKYDLIPTSASAMFQEFGTNQSKTWDLVEILNNQGVVLDTSNLTNPEYLMYAARFSHIPVINLINASRLNYVFMSSPVTTIDKLILKDDGSQGFTSVFLNCTNLENLTIEGKIGQNGFSVSSSTKITHDSLMSIINALQDKTGDTSGTSWVCTLGATNLAKLTDAEKQIATGKGWTLA